MLFAVWGPQRPGSLQAWKAGSGVVTTQLWAWLQALVSPGAVRRAVGNLFPSSAVVGTIHFLVVG